ncbi:hypothetical protein DMJ13_18690 [halophilic archaeon]|nr:hypothetical protein DMJ13_18690 [halophilic archaeon]
MLAVGVAVDVVRAGAGERVARHVIECHRILVLVGVLVALIRHVDYPGGVDAEAELFPLRAFLCRLVRFKDRGRSR